MPIRTAIVGFGYAGRSFHSYLVKLAQGLELYAISTRDPARRALAEKERGVKTYETIDQLLNDDQVQLVVIATPHDTHKDLCIQTMNAGKHCVVDKAMCLTTREADAMIAAAKKNKVLFSVFHNRRWDGDFLTVKKVKEMGLLGKWFSVESTVLGCGKPRTWRGEKDKCGGQLYDWGAHLVDHALLLMDSPPDTVFCDARPVLWDQDVDNYCKCVVKFKDGTLYTIELSRATRIKKFRWFIQGEKGTLQKMGVDPQEPAMVAGNIDAAKEDPANRAHVVAEVNGVVSEIILETIRGNWKAYYQNISDVLNKGAELAVKPEDVRKDIALIEAAMKSARLGRSVKV